MAFPARADLSRLVSCSPQCAVPDLNHLVVGRRLLMQQGPKLQQKLHVAGHSGPAAHLEAWQLVSSLGGDWSWHCLHDTLLL